MIKKTIITKDSNTKRSLKQNWGMTIYGVSRGFSPPTSSKTKLFSLSLIKDQVGIELYLTTFQKEKREVLQVCT